VRREDDGRFGFKFDGRWFGLPPDPSPDLKKAVCPTLLVRGANSSLLTSEGAAALISELPRARFVEIPAAGHHVQIERPAEVVAAMEAFLDETVSRTAFPLD
jgi:pimeloyl-ACP methyl ester carboxylesterase